MKAFLCAVTLAVACASQFGFGVFYFGTGNIKGYSFEYHRSSNLVLVRNATACFLVENGGMLDMSDMMRNNEERAKLETELFDQIQSETGETILQLTDLRTEFHDIRAVAECFHHDVFKLQYPMS